MKRYEVTEWYDSETGYINSAMPPIIMVEHGIANDLFKALEESTRIMKDAKSMLISLGYIVTELDIQVAQNESILSADHGISEESEGINCPGPLDSRHNPTQSAGEG